MVEINARKKKLHGELSAIKIQGMYRGWKARKELKRRMDEVKRRRKVRPALGGCCSPQS